MEHNAWKMGLSLPLTLINFEQGSKADLTPFFSIIKKIDNALLDENAQTKIKTILEEKVNVTLTE